MVIGLVIVSLLSESGSVSSVKPKNSPEVIICGGPIEGVINSIQ